LQKLGYCFKINLLPKNPSFDQDSSDMQIHFLIYMTAL